MNIRKISLVNGHYYHIFSRSIAKYIIFNDHQDYSRMQELIDIYRFSEFCYRYSSFLSLGDSFRSQYVEKLKNSSPKIVEIISYSIMPTHIHLTLKQIEDNGITKFMGKILNSYAKYFNIRHQRKGPLYEGNFKNVIVENDEQMLHLTRYQHLNPVSAGLVAKPEDWQYSSYSEYIDNSEGHSICDFKEIIDMLPREYQKFTNDQIDYQKKLSKIKHLLIDNYSG